MSDPLAGPWICLLCGPVCDETRHRKIEEHERCSVTIEGQALPVVYVNETTVRFLTPPPIGPMRPLGDDVPHKWHRVKLSGTNLGAGGAVTVGGKTHKLYPGGWFCPLCEGDCVEP